MADGDAGARGPALEAAVVALEARAVRHRAVQHPYLRALADGDLPDTRWALRDFARHYTHYSRHFPQYLTAVVSRLDVPAHRQLLLDNLAEESGRYGADELAALAAIGVRAEWIAGVAHPVLFQRFARAIGAEAPDAPESDAVRCWRELLMATLLHGSPAQAVGALGLGTEQIVRPMYARFVAAIARCPELSPADTVFFPLHTAVDDHHHASLRRIAVDLAGAPGGLDELRRGMVKALQLRASFWDWLHARALDPARADEVS